MKLVKLSWWCRWSALTLFVARVLADDHDTAVATNHLALVTDLLDARLDLHRALYPFERLAVDMTVDGVASDERGRHL